MHYYSNSCQEQNLEKHILFYYSQLFTFLFLFEKSKIYTKYLGSKTGIDCLTVYNNMHNKNNRIRNVPVGGDTQHG